MAASDRQAIEAIIRRERAARDAMRWDDLADCYTTDSLVQTSAFKGTGAEFAAASAKMADRLFSFHEVGVTTMQVNGARALADTGLSVHLVAEIEGVEVDCIGYTRTRTRATNGPRGWRIADFRTIYIHDLMVPTNPARVPPIDESLLKSFRKSYRCLSYMLQARGLTVRRDLAGVDRPETVEALIDDEQRWLNDNEGNG